jgi:Flp pilus assembly protein TadG
MSRVVVISSNQRKGERGSVLALAAICMLALILALGLCLDISHFYSLQTELQNGADAAALAGASALDSTSAGITLARTLAVAQMNKYEFNHNSINFSESNLYFASNFDALQSFLYPSSPQTCAALAAASTPANVERAGETKLNPAQVAFVGVCVPAAQAATIFFSSSVISNPIVIRGRAIAGNSPSLTGVCDNLAPLALLEDPTIPDSTEFAVGSVLTLKVAGGGSVAPGEYQLTDICGGGGSNVRQALAGNCKGCFGIGSTVGPNTGAKNGPTWQGWNDRFDSDLVTSDNITYAQYQNQYNDYLAHQSDPNYTPPQGVSINTGGSYGRRILVVLAVNVNDVINCGGSGCTWQVDDILAFFMQKHADNGNVTVTAEFIGKTSIANGTYGGTPIPSALSLTKIVLYK